MPNYNVKKSPIEGNIILEPEIIADKSGASYTSYSQKEFEQLGISDTFVHEEHMLLNRGILRGLYFQKGVPTAFLLRAISGSVLAVSVDLRPDSETYGASHSIELSAENCRMFYLPEGFAYGFLTLEQGSELIIKYSKDFEAEKLKGIIWNDEILAIDWQFERYDIDTKYLNVSKKDKKLPSFRQVNPETIWVEEKVEEVE